MYDGWMDSKRKWHAVLWWHTRVCNQLSCGERHNGSSKPLQKVLLPISLMPYTTKPFPNPILQGSGVIKWTECLLLKCVSAWVSNWYAFVYISKDRTYPGEHAWGTAWTQHCCWKFIWLNWIISLSLSSLSHRDWDRTHSERASQLRSGLRLRRGTFCGACIFLKVLYVLYCL